MGAQYVMPVAETADAHKPDFSGIITDVKVLGYDKKLSGHEIKKV